MLIAKKDDKTLYICLECRVKSGDYPKDAIYNAYLMTGGDRWEVVDEEGKHIGFFDYTQGYLISQSNINIMFELLDANTEELKKK